MSRRDIERYVQDRTGVTTPGTRDRVIDNLKRYPTSQEGPGPEYPRGFLTPPGFQAGNLTDIAAPATNQANALYLGQAPDDLNLVTVRMIVTTAVSTTTWAELAICTSLDASFGSPDLILEGFTGVGATFNSIGTRDTEIAVQIGAGAHCWLVWGSQASTPFAVRGGLADPHGSGRHAFASATRPSTMANPTTFTATTSASVAAWIAFIW